MSLLKPLHPPQNQPKIAPFQDHEMQKITPFQDHSSPLGPFKDHKVPEITPVQGHLTVKGIVSKSLTKVI